MFEVVELCVDKEGFSEELTELSKEGFEVKCSYTQRTRKSIPGSPVPFEIVLDVLVLQKKI